MLLFVLIVAISMINYIHLVTIKNLIMENIVHEIDNYKPGLHNTPFYIVVSGSFRVEEDLIFIKKVNDSFYFLKKEYLNQSISSKFYLLLMWETILFVCIIVSYYFTTHRLISNRERYINLFEVFSLVFNHKLRNFVSILKFNLVKTESNTSLTRIHKATAQLENDITLFNNLISLFEKNIMMDKRSSLLINNLIDEFLIRYPEKKVTTKQSRYIYKLPHSDGYFILYLLMDNAFRYSDKNIYLRTYYLKGNFYILIKNDIHDDIVHGLGVGLSTVEMLCKKHRWIFRFQKKTDSFIAAIAIPKSSRLYEIIL